MATARHLLGRLAVTLLLTSPAGCGVEALEQDASTATEGAVATTDDTGREVRLARPARRVVSLLPAGTETLLALGAADRVVGRTRYDQNVAVAHLPSVGGGLDPSLEALVALRPDLVIAFETAGGSKLRPRLEQLGIPVFAIQTQDTSDVFRNIRKLGHLVGRDAAADSLATSIRAELAAVRASAAGRDRPSVLYVASLDPPVVAGPSTFTAELLGVAGGDLAVVAPEAKVHWPQVSVEAIVRRQPDVVMLPVGDNPDASLERLRRAPGWRELRAVREGRVALVPADVMNRPGPQIAQIAGIMRDALRAHWGDR